MIEIPKDIFDDVPSKCKECNHNTTKWLIDHDKQIRDEVVDEFTEKMEKAIKDEINDEIISMFDGGTVMGAVKFIAEQMKGEQDE